jgi:hypothetical protein
LDVDLTHAATTESTSHVDHIDDLDAKWQLVASPKTQFDLLADHPWIWRNDPERTGEIVAGALWTAGADLVAEPIDDERPVVAAIAPRSIIRIRRRPIESGEVARFLRVRKLDLIPSGVELPAIRVVYWGNDSPGQIAGQSIELALPDGRSAWIPVKAQEHPSGGGHEALTWRELACAAVVVPVRHPLASQPTACAALLDRIERRADDAWRAYMRSAASC